MYTSDGVYFITDYSRFNLRISGRQMPHVFGKKLKMGDCPPIHYTNIASGKLWTDRHKLDVEHQACAMTVSEYEKILAGRQEEEKIPKSKEDKHMGILGKKNQPEEEGQGFDQQGELGSPDQQPQGHGDAGDARASDGAKPTRRRRAVSKATEPTAQPEVKTRAPRKAPEMKVKTILIDGLTGMARCIMTNGDLHYKFSPFCGIKGLSKDTRVIIENAKVLGDGTTVEIDIQDAVRECEGGAKRR